VARCARLPGESDVAEVAVTVVDEYQGRGLGRLLFTLLAASTRGAGIERFRAYVLPDNARVRAAADRLGARATLESPGLLRYEVSLRDLAPGGHELVEARAGAPRAEGRSGPAIHSRGHGHDRGTNRAGRERQDGAALRR
jgi:hypothetical protein